MRFPLDDRTFEALAEVPDFRNSRGRQFDIGDVLAPVVIGRATRTT